MKRTRSIACLSFVATVVLGAAMAAEPVQNTPAKGTTAEQVLTAMDQKADPCSDFYRYACGGWLDATKLPGDQSRWGRGFTEIGERNRAILRDILDDARANTRKGGDTAKLGNFYDSCLDEETIEKLGATPIKPLLEQVAAAKDPASLMRLAGQLHAMRIPVLFDFGAEPDFKNPDINIAGIGQGGLGLLDRDYYLKTDERSQKLRQAYVATVATMLGLAGETPEAAKKDADAILAFETKLASFSRTRTEMRDPDKLYHKVDMAGLQALSPALPWAEFVKAVGAPKITAINVATPEFFEGLDKEVKAAAPETLQAYLRWHVVRSTSGQLSKPFVEASFNFYRKTLGGQKELEPRWKRCTAGTDMALGEMVGKFFVEKQFPGDSKKIALDMIQRIEAAFAAGLPQLGWMDDETRARAIDKMHALANKIGYPDKWRDYSTLTVKAGDWYGNALRARQFSVRIDLEKIGKPVDKAEWGMTPPTVNAYYNPLGNEIVFPAGILQPPFFDHSFPAAMNFGGIGMVMGHELTHGFDDEGRKFDPKGKLVAWWAPSVSEKFEKQTQCIETLYNGFEVQPGVKLNGKLTMGENIADFGGIKAAYRAYKQFQKEHPASGPAVPGLSDDQLFFVGFAQTWCQVATPEIERQLAVMDPHSAPRFRVNGPLSNLAEFAQAFSCGKGKPMNPETQCTIW